jgi:hypothetical protein
MKKKISQKAGFPFPGQGIRSSSAAFPLSACKNDDKKRFKIQAGLSSAEQKEKKKRKSST